MRKRLVRKAFDMILGISCSENRDVSFQLSSWVTVPCLSAFSSEIYCRIMKGFGRIMENF